MFTIKSMQDLERVFLNLGRRAHVLGARIPHLGASLDHGLTYIFRNHGAYKGNPFEVLEENITKSMDEEEDVFQKAALRSVLADVIHYKGTWNLLRENMG